MAVRGEWYQASGNSARGAAFGTDLDGMIARHAASNGVPLELARRVVARESGGNPRAVSRGNYGLMQIRHGTARAMGYSGSAAGLLDPETNMTYAMKYLAGAYRAAGGNQSRAVALYARGYYYEAKRQGWSPYEGGNGYSSSYGVADANDATVQHVQKSVRRRGLAPEHLAWNDAPGADWGGAYAMQSDSPAIHRPWRHRHRR